MSLPLEGVRVLDLSRLLPGRLLLAAARRLRRRRGQGRGHRDGRLRPVGAALLRGRGAERALGALPRAEPQQALDPRGPQGRAPGARCCCAWRARPTSLLESFRPGVLERLGVGYETLRAREPGPRVLRDHRLRPGRAATRPLRPRLQLPRPRAGCSASPARRTARRSRPRGRSPTSAAARSWPPSASWPRCAIAIAPGRARSSTSRWPTARCRGWRWSRRATSPTAWCPHRGELELAGSLICYRPTQCADGWVTLGALEPKFWRGVLSRASAART